MMESVNLETGNLNFVLDYYNMPSKDVALKHGLGVSPSRLYHLLPLAIGEEVCPNCSEKMLHRFVGRSTIKDLKEKYAAEDLKECLSPDLTCSCGHSDSLNCYCSYCHGFREDFRRKEMEIQEKIDSLRTEKIMEVETAYLEGVVERKLKDLSLMEYISSYALYSSFPGRIEEHTHGYQIPPLNNPSEKLIPSTYSLREFIEPFNNILTISGRSSINAFTWNDKGSPETYDHEKVHHLLHVPDLNLILKEKRELSEVDETILFEYLRRIKIAECFEYFNMEMKKVYGFFSPGHKTNMVIETLLEDFDVEEIYYFISLGVKNALYNYHSGTVSSKKHAANQVISCMDNVSARAKKENWSNRYTRPHECCKSTLRITLDYFLK